jgi:AraC-like DNA-binding protein
MNKPDHSRTEIPLGYFHRFDQLLQERGIDTDTLFEQCGLTLRMGTLKDASVEIAIDALEQVFARAIEQSRDPCLGFYLGSRMPLTTHGILGYAAMSGQNLRQSIQTIVRYLKTVNQLLRLSLIETDDRAYIQLDDNYCFHQSRSFFHEVFASAIQCMFGVLTGDRFRYDWLGFAYPQPAHADRYEALFDCDIVFEVTETRLGFAAALLDLPLVFADKNAHAMAAAQCEQKLQTLNASEDLAARIRTLLLESKGNYPGADEIALKFNMTQRTLRRHLAREATSFSDILGDVRHQHALEYMQNHQLKLCEIAYLLGYSDPNNFGRAFKKWTQLTPAEYRAQQGE